MSYQSEGDGRAAVVERHEPVPGAGDDVRRSGDLLRISGLRTHFATQEGVVKAIDGVDLTIPRGRTVCVVGESGCGKSVTARSVLQLVDPPGRIIAGSIEWFGSGDSSVDLASLGPRSESLRRIRGAGIGMIFQEPMASLSPMYTVGQQLVEAIRLHQPLSKEAAREKAVEELMRVGIPQPQRRIDMYPFQLSGGMCQRVMIAMALCCGPELLIADEPTTALDVTTQARILDLLTDLQEQTGMSVMFITHDLGVVAEIADEVSVMYLGRVVERGTTQDIFDNPRHPYTQALLRSVPALGTTRRGPLSAIRGIVPHPQNRPAGCPFRTRCDYAVKGLCDQAEPPLVQLAEGHLAACHLLEPSGAATAAATGVRVDEVTTGQLWRRADRVADAVADVRVIGAGAPDAAAPRGEPLLELTDLRMEFPIRDGLFGRTSGRVRAVDGVSLTIRPGQTLGLVGESGCGKTTLGRCIARSLKPTGGQIGYRYGDGVVTDLATLSERELRRFRREVRVVFQDPFSSLNPRMTLLQLVGEPLRANHLASGSELTDRVADMLGKVGLRPEYIRRYPHAFSGGERQRINIARALVTQPRLVIADEPVSALDVSVRAQILNLLRDLQDELDLTYLFISHDLSVVQQVCDEVTVMYLGSVVETTTTDELYAAPHHPYTEALLKAVPSGDPHVVRDRSRRLADDLPDPSNPPSGCRFHTRCPHARDGLCHTDVPLLELTAPGHRAACHYAGDLALEGVAVPSPRASAPSGPEEGQAG